MSKHRTRGTRLSRLMSGVLCLALMLSLLPSAGLIQPAKAAYWADPYGEQLVEWGVMNPSSDLRLGSTITRAEFVAMCNRAFGYTKLGSMPFVDVRSSKWYAQDINIAYNAGYFYGGAGNTADPEGTLTREMAAVLIARNLVLQETVGEVQAFTDSHALSEWSRGLIGAAVAEGMVGGYEDGSYRPKQSITRGEVAKMLVSVIGTPINKPGRCELGGVYGNLTISSSNVELRNTTVVGNLYITGGVDLGNVLLENVTVLGRVVISGGGESNAGQSSVVLRNVAADELVIDSLVDDRFVTVSAYGITDIPNTYVRSDTWLQDVSSAGYGLQYIELDGDPGTRLQLAGTIKEVLNKTPFSDLQLVQGTAQKITIDEYATGSTLKLDYNTRVDELNLDVATLVYGEGDITNLNIWASDCDVEILPGKVTMRPGLTATVAGEVIDHNGAAELSEDPRLLAGYPTVPSSGLTPTAAEAQFSGNKSGTIYYAVSELADGSIIDPEDLVNNPAYGGIIYQGQAGSIASSSRTVYSRSITQLQPDGDYYLTAMLEDGRGNRSPLKVISFTTPDNTRPEFLNGRISRATCEVVQLTGMANKSCTLYWVLLADGATAPTAQNFKSGTFGGNYGRGSMNVTKNVPVSINVNGSIRLQEDTDYDLYVWLNDFNGAQNSQVYKFDVHTPDETPPVVTEIMQSDYGESDAQVTFKVNEHPSTLYWAVVTESNQTFINEENDWSGDLRNQIKVESGATSIVHGGTAARGANMDTDILKSVLRGLSYATYGTHSFKLYYVAKDAAGNYSEVGKLDIHTLDTDPPHAWLEYSDSVNGVPQANSDIKIVFDEQVKGTSSATAQTFLEYYEAVTNASNATAKTAAKTAMATELNNRIKLYYTPATGGSPTQVPVRTTVPSVGSGTTASDHWICWNEAVITMEQGKLVITLAAGTAISLQSGANYYFQFTGVYDDAFTPNGIAVDTDGVTCVKTGGKASDNGNGRLYFTTLYAQVEMYQNTSVSSAGDGGDRLDIVVDVKPKSTAKVPATEYWDLIMWSDTVMTVDVYRQEIKLDDNGNEPENVTATWDKVATGIRFNYVNAGVGLTNSTTSKTYGKVQDGLKEGYLYRYGIHIKSMGSDGIEESPDSKQEPTVWSDLVTMSFSLIAGTSGNVSDVSKQVNLNTNANANYNNYLSGGRISEIGVVYTSTGTQSILSCSKQFRDTTPPSFLSSYPKFTTGSGGMTIEVALDRPGTVYYVVAPIGTVLVNLDGSTPVTNANDGRTGGPVTSGKRTYIPEDGEDRDKPANQSQILFVEANSGDRVYKTPAFLNIYNGSSVYGKNPKVQAGSWPVDSAGGVEYIPVTNLDPLTHYYVYFVLEGAGGGTNDIVEIYRQDTTKMTPPAVQLVASTADVNMKVFEINEDGSSSDVYFTNPQLYYALVEWNSLPATFTTEFTPTVATGETAPTLPSNVKTVLDAMIYRVSGSGQTWFDKYASSTLKNTVMTYITSNSGEGTATGNALRRNTTTNPKDESFGSNMTSGGEYVLLACARGANDTDTTGAAYGYAAVRSLFKPDTVPPEFKPNEDYPRLIRLNGAKWNTDDSFSGTIVISFDKEIYYRASTGDLTNYDVVYSTVADGSEDAKTKKNIIKVLGGDAVEHVSVGTNSGSVGLSITLNINGIKDGQQIVVFGSGLISNSSGYTTTKKLTLTFDASLTSANYYPNEVVGNTSPSWPGFRVTWG